MVTVVHYLTGREFGAFWACSQPKAGMFQGLPVDNLCNSHLSAGTASFFPTIYLNVVVFVYGMAGVLNLFLS